jgi:dihydrodipicolinate synthase/N-acetylneuraminate lyase
MQSKQDLIKNIKGNIVPLPAQFNDDLSLNLKGMEQHLQYLIDNKVKNIYLALAASEFRLMTLDERLSITKMVVKISNSQVNILAQPVTGNWVSEQAEEAKQMIDLGADVLVVKLMELKENQKFFSSGYRKANYDKSYHEDAFIEQLKTIADYSKGYIILHDKPFRSFEYLDKVTNLDCIVGIKSHEEEPFRRYEMYRLFGDDYICFDGLGKTNQLWSLLWGAKARHTCWSWFDPVGDQKFYDYVNNKDINSAVELVNREWPITNAILSTGFRGYKYLMELKGLPSGPTRIVGEQNLSNKEKQILSEAFQAMNLNN